MLYTFEYFDLTNLGGKSVVAPVLVIVCILAFWYLSSILVFLEYFGILVANQRLPQQLSAFGAAAASGLVAASLITASPTRQRESCQSVSFIKIITKGRDP